MHMVDLSIKPIRQVIKMLSSILGIDEDVFDGFIEEGKLVSTEIDGRLKARVGSKYVPGALSPDKRPLLYAVVRALSPENAVETGVHVGVSTTVILKALNNGILYSIDINRVINEPLLPALNGLEVGFLVPEELRHKWRLVIGDSKKVLKQLLDGLGDIQFFLHDSDHSYDHVVYELNEAWNHMRRGIIIIDNFKFSNATIDFANKVNAKVIVLSRSAGGFAMIPRL